MNIFSGNNKKKYAIGMRLKKKGEIHDMFENLKKSVYQMKPSSLIYF